MTIIASPTVHYQELLDRSWNCDWWEVNLHYGARGKTPEEALQNALEFKRQGLVIGIEHYKGFSLKTRLVKI